MQRHLAPSALRSDCAKNFGLFMTIAIWNDKSRFASGKLEKAILELQNVMLNILGMRTVH